MKTLAKLVAELAALRAVVVIHQAKISAACDVADAAEEAFENVWGYSPRCNPEGAEYAVAWKTAYAAYEALTDDDGYFWTWSRIRDLENIVEPSCGSTLRFFSEPSASWSCGTLHGIGGIPHANPAVAAFVVETLGLAQAA